MEEVFRFTTFARDFTPTLLKALRNIPFPHSSRVSQRQHCIILRSKCCIVLIRSSCDSSSTSFRRDSFCHRLEAGVPVRKPKNRCLISSRVKPVCLALYDGEPMEHRAVVAPLTTDPLSGKKYANPFVITDRGRSESKLSSDFGDS